MYHGDRSQESAQYFPAVLALNFAAADGDDEADEGGELGDGGEAHEETTRPPHGTEIVIAHTVFLGFGERPAGFVEGGVAVVMQAEVLRVGLVAVVDRDVQAHPVRHEDGGKRHGRSWWEVMLAMARSCGVLVHAHARLQSAGG